MTLACFATALATSEGFTKRGNDSQASTTSTTTMTTDIITHDTHAQNEERFDYVLDRIGAISPFGPEIGDQVSKAQIAIAVAKVHALREEYRRLFCDAGDAYERLSEFLPYAHPLLVNLRASLNLPQY